MAYHQAPLAETSVIKFKGQDFQSLRDHCLRKGKLFEDDTFPAADSSIGQQLLQEKDLQNAKWKRPQEMDPSRGPPYFILEDASRFDIQQGNAGDCWVLAALGSLTQSPQCLQRILPTDQSFSHKYAGIFHFRFWQCGEWVDVVVDDRLPVRDQRHYLFVRPCQNNHEFWPCLLEKAYAKLHGSYSNLHYGFLEDAFVDLTGGVVTIPSSNLTPSELMMMVKTAAQAGSLMACQTSPGPTTGDNEMENGLVSLHAYTVTGAEQVQYRRGWENIMRLWNPWGQTEWKGRWSDRSLEWQETQDPKKHQLYKNKDDGEFWISCRDFQNNFSRLSICNQIPISLDHRNMLHEAWSIKHESQVMGLSLAEGPWQDPQYFFTVQDPMEGYNVIVSGTIKPQSLTPNKREIPLTFRVYKVDPQFQQFQKRLPPKFFSQGRDHIHGMRLNTKFNVTRYLHLSPGTYVVSPWTTKDEVGFFLRIFVKLPDRDRNLDNFNLRGIKANLPESRIEQNIFQRYAQQKPDIDAPQLQHLLNQEFLQGLPGDTFSLDECRSIVALMDLKVNGRLDQEEFKRLWERLTKCQAAFQNTRRSSGDLLSEDLWQAIKNTDFLAGVSISRELLDLMTLRYSDSAGKVSFPSLVCFLMRLEVMSKTFRNLSQDGQGLYLTEMQWMNLVMYS
ncbi:calpain-13 [Tenrec ecaudatus]|uniref:calpain-13 n=1 Tax=Tenrec ecaudatus TaxID=94439 RepID=UPI003F5A0D18